MENSNTDRLEENAGKMFSLLQRFYVAVRDKELVGEISESLLERARELLTKIDHVPRK